MRTRLLAVAAVAALGLPYAQAQEPFPTRPIRMVVPFPPGAASDFLARTVGQKLSERYGQQVVTDNRPGAGGLVGSTLIANSVPDGYTLGMVGQPHLINPLLHKDASYRALEDTAPVILVAALPNVLVVAPALPVKTVADLIALAKAKPGALNFGSAGIGSSSHVAAESFKAAAGIDAAHIPFKLLSDVFTEMLAGRVQFYLFPLPATMPMLRDNKLRALAVGTAKPTALLPGVPTIGESGLAGFVSESWFGVVGPAKMPRAIVLKLNKDINEILVAADTRERFQRQGAEAVGGTPQAFGDLMKAEYLRYQKLVKDAGISIQ